MFRAIAFVICLCCSLSFACSSEDSSSTAKASDNSQAEIKGATEDPIEIVEEQPPAVPDASPTASPATEEPEEPALKPSGIIRTATEVIDASGLGGGILPPLGTAPLPDSFTEVELLIAGDATSYTPLASLTADGLWVFEEDTQQPYKIRVVVRFPSAELFSGVVVSEWMNVTAGVDNSVDWAFLSEEIGREGHAFIGVSAQLVGIMGRDTGRIPSGLIDTRGLPTRDPVRYGDLTHPGDEYSFDIFTQASLAASTWLSELYSIESERLIAVGQSQSAGYLTSYINAVDPIVMVFDGYLIHGRGDGAPNPAMDERLSSVLIREDVDVPVLIFETETDLNVLQYANARQVDAENIRTWEVAGAAHSDTYSLAYPNGLPRQASLGAVIGCENLINDGPQHETLQAAFHQLNNWIASGDAPNSSPRIELEDGEELIIARDERGIAIGGVRTPPVTVPLRILSGDPVATEGFCFLFGDTTELSPETLVGMYGSLDSYVQELQTAAAESVSKGWLLQADADIMVEEETQRAVSLGLTN